MGTIALWYPHHDLGEGANVSRTVFLKQSGERLAKGGEEGEVFSPSGVRAVGEKIARAYHQREELGVLGMTVVSGAGNIIRGDKLREEQIVDEEADFLGRLALVQNTVVIAAQLRRLQVPHLLLLTEKMKIEDFRFHSTPYSSDRMQQAHAEGLIVLIAGGTGEDDVTTDNAVVFYAGDFRSNGGEGDVTILKGTQYDGVFEGDPKLKANLPRFRRIGAPTMLGDYDNFDVVDVSCLRQLVANNLSMLVYADGAHDLETVLRHDPSQEDDGSSIGTLIVPEEIKPEYYPPTT